MTRNDIIRMERCHVKAWPAFETRNIDGWHWRYSGGGSQRANSVSTVDFNGEDPGFALDKAESPYAAKRTVTRIQTFDFTQPLGLDDLLRTRGYKETENTLTMVKRIEAQPVPPDTEQYDHAAPEWREVYLGAITEIRRAVNTQILENIPEPRAFFACHRNGRAISTALSVVGYGCAVVECVATREDARRQGGSRKYAACAGSLGWNAGSGHSGTTGRGRECPSRRAI